MKTQVDILKEYRIPVRGQLGQHLLIDPNIQNKIVDLLALKKGDWVLEVGPGLGALTAPMLQRGAHVLAIEKDRRFVETLEKVFQREIAAGQLKLFNQDVLESDIEGVLREGGAHHPVKVASNLPYYITGPVLFLVLSRSSFFETGVFMMQQEVAARLMAEPGRRDYGRLSVAVRLYAEVRHAFDVSPRCFTPPPEVHSSVVTFDFHHRLPGSILVSEQELLEFIKLAFSQRRKKLLSVLGRARALGRTPEDWEDIFAKLEIKPTARAEELLVRDFIALSNEAAAGRRPV